MLYSKSRGGAMASTVSRKHHRAAARTRPTRKPGGERFLTDAQGKRIAVVLDLEEYRQLVEGKRKTAPVHAPASNWDWIAAARDLRARATLAPDSTPILRAIREERAHP